MRGGEDGGSSTATARVILPRFVRVIYCGLEDAQLAPRSASGTVPALDVDVNMAGNFRHSAPLPKARKRLNGAGHCFFTDNFRPALFDVVGQNVRH